MIQKNTPTCNWLRNSSRWHVQEPHKIVWSFIFVSFLALVISAPAGFKVSFEIELSVPCIPFHTDTPYQSQFVILVKLNFVFPQQFKLVLDYVHTRCRYDLKTEQNHYGKASCSHDAGMKTIWRRYEMKTELLSVWNENGTLSGIVWTLTIRNRIMTVPGQWCRFQVIPASCERGLS